MYPTHNVLNKGTSNWGRSTHNLYIGLRLLFLLFVIFLQNKLIIAGIVSKFTNTYIFVLMIQQTSHLI